MNGYMVRIFPGILQRNTDKKEPIFIIGFSAADLNGAAKGTCGNIFNIIFFSPQAETVIIQFKIDIVFLYAGYGKFKVKGGFFIINARAQICRQFSSFMFFIFHDIHLL